MPSFPSSPRIEPTSRTTFVTIDELTPDIKEAIEFLQQDHELLIAAEIGNEKVLQDLIAPSLKVAKLLFEYGAQIMPRICPVDTGLLLQFVMMCLPTREEEKILRLLVEKGALVDDPEAPGGRQALHFAAMSDNCELIEILVDLGADLFNKNHRDETPREVALTFQCRDAYNLLTELEDMVSYNTNSLED